MDLLAQGNWFREAVPSLIWLVVAAAVAFGVGLLLRYRRAKIQQQYQQRMKDREQSKGT